MKYKLRRLIAVMAIVIISAYAGSLNLKLTVAIISGMLIGLLFNFEDRYFTAKYSEAKNVHNRAK